MRVLHVAAFVSSDGSYGGPVSVALDQAGALAQMGHDVTVAAGWDGKALVSSPASVKLFRAYKPMRRSFVGLLAPGILPWVARHAKEFDVVHVHVTRDFLTLPVAALVHHAGVPLILQTHGQIRPRPSRAQAVLDVLFTRRIFRGAAAFLALTSREEKDLLSQGAPAHLIHKVVNGVPQASAPASFAAEQPLVLFSSRLAARKRPQAFVEAAELVLRERSDVRFELWGPDGGELDDVIRMIRAKGLGPHCTYRGAVTVEASRANLGRCQVFVLPSLAEPFPMALLEAFGAGVPAVITDQTGLSEVAGHAGAARVTDGSPEELADAILALLDRKNWDEASEAGLRLSATEFSLRGVAEHLIHVYASLPGRRLGDGGPS